MAVKLTGEVIREILRLRREMKFVSGAYLSRRTGGRGAAAGPRLLMNATGEGPSELR